MGGGGVLGLPGYMVCVCGGGGQMVVVDMLPGKCQGGEGSTSISIVILPLTGTLL